MMEDKIKNDDLRARLDEVRLLIAEDLDSEAILRLKSILKTSPENLEALLLYAQASPSSDKAKQTINKILDIDPDNAEARMLMRRIDKEAELTATASQPSAIPTINIVNNNDNTSSANASAAVMSGIGGMVDGGTNKTAFWIGFIATFFGLFGLAHMFNDRILKGLLYLFVLGPLFIFVLSFITALTAGVGIIVTVPLYFVGAWRHAKKGAKKDPQMMMMTAMSN